MFRCGWSFDLEEISKIVFYLYLILYGLTFSYSFKAKAWFNVAFKYIILNAVASCGYGLIFVFT